LASFSVSHLSPSWDIPTQYLGRSRMHYNREIDRLLRAHGSPTHFFGHTHGSVDARIEGVRYVNEYVGYERSKRCARFRRTSSTWANRTLIEGRRA
jgi:hypothetical protein